MYEFKKLSDIRTTENAVIYGKYQKQRNYSKKTYILSKILMIRLSEEQHEPIIAGSQYSWGSSNVQSKQISG